MCAFYTQRTTSSAYRPGVGFGSPTGRERNNKKRTKKSNRKRYHESCAHKPSCASFIFYSVSSLLSISKIPYLHFLKIPISFFGPVTRVAHGPISEKEVCATLVRTTGYSCVLRLASRVWHRAVPIGAPASCVLRLRVVCGAHRFTNVLRLTSASCV